MPRLFGCALAIALTLVALAPAAPVPQHLMKQPVYYFPTKVGTKLEYQELERGDVPGRELTMVVTAVSERGGAKVVSVGRVASDESVTPLMTVVVTGAGLYRVERAGRALDTPEVWLQIPVVHDQVWEYSVGDPTIHPRPVARQRVVGIQDVTVPAGTFRCVGVNGFQDGRSLTCWYAPEVGLVKTEAAAWTEVLKAYTPAKD